MPKLCRFSRALAAAVLIVGGSALSPARAEEPMDRVMGTLEHPDTVRIRLQDGTLLIRDKAIAYLKDNGYIVETGDKRQPYRTTEKYVDWKKTPRLQYVEENLNLPFTLQKVFLSNGQVLTDSGGDYLIKNGYMEEFPAGSSKYRFTAKYHLLKAKRGKFWGDVFELSGENKFTGKEYREKNPSFVIDAPAVSVRFRVEPSDRDSARRKLEIEPKTIKITHAWYYYCKHGDKPLEHTDKCKVNTTVSTCVFQNGDYDPKALADYPAGFNGAWGAAFRCDVDVTVAGTKQSSERDVARHVYEQYTPPEKAFEFRIEFVQSAQWLLR